MQECKQLPLLIVNHKYPLSGNLVEMDYYPVKMSAVIIIDCNQLRVVYVGWKII